MFYYSTAHKEVPSLFCGLCVSPRPCVVSLAFFVSLVLRGDLKSRFSRKFSWLALERYFISDDPIFQITGSPDLKALVVAPLRCASVSVISVNQW